MKTNITFTEGENSSEQEIPETVDNGDCLIAVMIVTVLLGTTVLVSRRRKN